MSEEEDKPKPEGEQPSTRDEAAEKQRAREEELERRRERLVGKSLDEILAEIFAMADEIGNLANGDNDWWALENWEMAARFRHLDLLQYQFRLAFAKKRKEEKDYLKWALVFHTENRASLAVDGRNIKERKKSLDKRPCGFDNVENLKELAGRKNLSLGEIAQLHTLDKLDGMIWENYKFTTEAKMSATSNSISTIEFQSEVAETMLAVRQRLESSEQVQAKTAKILEGVKENTDKKGQFILIVAASALVTVSVGFIVELVLRGWGNEMVAFLKEYPLRAILWALVLVFAGLEIGTRVKKKRSGGD